MSTPFAYLKSAGETNPGLKRKNNEDSLLLLPQAGLFCVADGMGGAKGGEVASKATVDALEQTFSAAPEAPYAITALAAARLAARALNQASNWIREQADELGLSGMGSTVVALLFERVDPSRALLLHAGDSRAYRFRDGKLEQLTSDHSVAAAAGVENEEKLPAMFRGVITRAVGLERTVELEETEITVAQGDLFLVCSDGLTKMVSDKNITRILKKSENLDLDQRAAQLIDAALEAGGSDNVTVVLALVAGELPPAPVMPVPDETRALEAISLPQRKPAAAAADEAMTGQTADTASQPKVGVTPQSGASDQTPPQPHSGEGLTPDELREAATVISPGTLARRRHRARLWLALLLLLLLLAGLAAAAIYFYSQSRS